MSRSRALFLVPLLVMAAALRLEASLTFTPSQPKIGQSLAFFLSPVHTPADSRPINWTFGDGSVVETASSVLTVSHVFPTAGTFTVVVSYAYIGPSGGPPIPFREQITVTVSGFIRTVTFSPAQPNIGEPVTFQALNFLTPATIDWDFGDGVTVNDGSSVQTHVYNTAGTFLVQVRDQGGSASPFQLAVPVVNKRQVQAFPAEPKTGQAVQFQALNFTTACIKWDFGDGTILAQGTAAASHIYAMPGSFQVTAQDNCGNSPWSASLAVLVTPSLGPLAGFDISYGLLRFADGKTSAVVARNEQGLTAFADLKFEGSGTVQFEWLVDGLPFRTDSAVLTFGQQTTVSSGATPGLPTSTPGPHTVALRFLRPRTSFTLAPITYTVVAMRPGDKAPVVEKTVPDEVEPGKEVELELEGRNLTAGTTFSLGLGIGVVQSPVFISSSKVRLKVFVSPTAKPGARLVKASNPAGSNTGPGKMSVVIPPALKKASPALLACPELKDLPHFVIKLKSPGFWQLAMPEGVELKGDVVQPKPPQGESKLNLQTVDDSSVLRWELPFKYYDYVEVRFFRPTGKAPILTKQIAGTAESLILSGALLAEIFEAIKPSGYMTVNPEAVLIGQNEAVLQPFTGEPGAGPAPDPYDKFYAEGVQAGADIAWQVAAYRVYPCVRDPQSSGTQSLLNQPVEEASSALWLFNLPHSFTGLSCPATGVKKAGVTIMALNKSAGLRDQQAGPGGPTSNINFVGDLITLQGSFSLTGSPYASHVPSGNSVKIENLFIDWGDGSSAVPVRGTVQGDGNWSKEKKVSLSGGPEQSHRYQTEGTHTIRIFQLSEDDIQFPPGDFTAALGAAVTPGSQGGGSYKNILDLVHGPQPAAEHPAADNPLAEALPRAYMICCINILISHYADLCAKGPLHLVSLEIMNFPGHDLFVQGQGAPGPEGGVMVRKDLLAAYSGFHAVAVECDEALIARSRLRYYGTGAVFVTWIVDESPVQHRTYELASTERLDLPFGDKSGCADALVSELIFTSDPLTCALGKHSVRVRAEYIPHYSMPNLSLSMEEAVKNIQEVEAARPGPSLKKAPSGPAEVEWDGAAAGGQTYDPFVSMLALEEKKGMAIPQIGVLSPEPETNGQPPVVYLNDALKSYDPPSSSSGPWLNGDALPSSTALTSETKGYVVNEVRDVKFCRIIFPTSGGEFKITDLGGSIQLQADVYSGQGAFHYSVRTGGGAVEKHYAHGTAFAGWSIEESSGRVMKGSLDSSPQAGGTLFFPAGLRGILRRFQGDVDGQALSPLTASFDLELGGMHGAFLKTATGTAGQPPAWKNAAGSLTTEGDWVAAGLSLPSTAIGLTGFLIEATAVTVDFSRLAAPPDAEGDAAAPDWMGVYLGDSAVTPPSLGFVGQQALTMKTTEPWRLTDAGLYGSARSGPYSAQLDEASLSFNHLDFQVAADVPQGTYHQCAIHVPWVNAVLKGDAVLQLISAELGYGINWLGLTAPLVTLDYEDKGRISLTVDGLVWGRDARGWRARGHAYVATEAEDKPFAAFHLNGICFGTDGVAYFDGPSWQASVVLSGSTAFGGATAVLKEVQVKASAASDRLSFAIEAQVQISPDSDYISPAQVLIHYKIVRNGAGYAGLGPWNAPFSTKVVFPLGSQEIDSSISPTYEYAPGTASTETAGAWGVGWPTPAGGMPDMRFGGEIDLGMFGCEAVKGEFVLGYQGGKSFFLLFASYDKVFIPLSPVPLAILGIGGGFAYNFSPEVFRHSGLSEAQPDMAGTASFCAQLTIGTSDRYTIMSDGYIVLNTGGSAEMGFKNAKLMQQGNFGGYINYYNKAVTGKVWGQLDLLGGLINFNLGTEAHPAIEMYFGPGGWHVYAGRKSGPRIKATIFKAGGADSYLELDNQGLRAGGSQLFELRAGPSLLNGYVKSWMDIALAITIDPFSIQGSWEQGVAAGGCVLGVCEDFSVSAVITAHAPNPTFMKAAAQLDFGPLGTASLEVGLKL